MNAAKLGDVLSHITLHHATPCCQFFSPHWLAQQQGME